MQPHNTTRACKTCGQSFTFKSPKQIYCSRACLRRVARQKQYAKNAVVQCEYCGKEFCPRTDKTTQRFCSKRCANLSRFHSPGHIAATSERFWSFVDKTGDCWNWTATKYKGYGHFAAIGRVVKAHRFSWELHNGSIPDGLSVCHRCDNPSCVRPDHLFLGTAKDNAQDKVNKGRHPLGEQSVGRKLTEADVRAIRASSLGVRVLARQYGVAHSTIGNIIHRRKWRHIP